jgi:thiazole/oxazole-forming peptide maturase SagD family component
MATSTARRTHRLMRGWLLGVVPEGLVAVGGELVVEVRLQAQGPAERGVAELALGTTRRRLAAATGVTVEEADLLLGRLADCGAIGRSDGGVPATDGPNSGSRYVPLVEALLGDHDRRWRGPHPVATADELLLVPRGLAPALRARLLRDFVAGITPRARGRAYAYAIATGRRTLFGDAPAPDSVRKALTSLAPADSRRVHVCDLRTGAVCSLAVERIGAVGAGRRHRLGTVPVLRQVRWPELLELGLRVAVAEHAAPDPGEPCPPAVDRRTKGVARTARRASLVARAEAAERFAAGSPREMRHASGRDLEDAVSPESIFAGSERQRVAGTAPQPYDPNEARPWLMARSLAGRRRLVPAEAVLSPYPKARGRSAVPASSSGVAAGRTVAAAREAALGELVERDAFMWTWIQRLARELVDVRTFPEEIRAGARTLQRHGLETALVNLTLETDPVLLCAIHDASSTALGAGCDRDPARAAMAAFREAAVTRLAVEPPAAELDTRSVATPEDHAALYRRGSAPEEARFLYSSAQRIALGEITGAAAPLAAAVAAIGEPVEDPLFVDLSVPATRPFRVVRAIVPGLVPISFGFDREPLGMALLARPRNASADRKLGRELELGRAGPLTPHPFA